MSGKIDRDAVAHLAGVSSATVSRVYNNPAKVSPEKRQRVLEAAGQLGYEPNRAASALARRTTGRILFVDGMKLFTHDKSNAPYYASLYSQVLGRVNRVLQDSLFTLTLSDVTLSHINMRDYDGTLLFDVDSPEQLGPFLSKPLCAGHHLQDHKGKDFFCTDNYYGGELVGKCLQEKGFGKALYVTGMTEELSSHRQRLAGLQRGYPGHLKVVHTDIGYQGGRRAAQQLLPQLTRGEFKAVAVVNDLTALGFYHQLLSQGVRIPEEVSLIGYDNLPISQLLPRPLTTIDIGLEGVYEEAARHLIKILRGVEFQGESPRIFPPRIHWGESLG